MSSDQQPAVRAWLLALWALVLVMVMIGGITRLTGSGLSIVEWRPVSGALPPIGEHAWEQAFAQYRASPQFVHDNNWMTLGDFKRIYFWEYVHRLFGRTLGLAFLLPWAYFVWRGRLSRSEALRTISVLLLGALQGFAGWYMVKSGLVREPRVSHYRLALHLLLGVGTGQWILWQALELRAPRQAAYALARSQRLQVLCLLPLLVVQFIYGAFMAGTRAGYVAATFPDLNGHYGPAVFFTSGSLARDLLDNPLSIHYLHRVLAFAVMLYATWLAYRLRRERLEVRAAAYLLLAAVFGQILLGALTVVLHVPIAVAVAHQAGAYVLAASAVLLTHAVLGGVSAPIGRTSRASDALADAQHA
jgi:cytochrome c oxidase assembly protein subunit 15